MGHYDEGWRPEPSTKPEEPVAKPNDEISVPVWYSNGSGIMVLRSSLLSSHPDSTYNYIKNVLGKRPEDYGYDIVQLTDEQKEVLRSVPDEAIYEEMRYREVQAAAEDLYGDNQKPLSKSYEIGSGEDIDV